MRPPLILHPRIRRCANEAARYFRLAANFAAAGRPDGQAIMLRTANDWCIHAREIHDELKFRATRPERET